MKLPVALPFNRPPQDTVSAIWAVRPDADGDVIPDWDPNTDLGVSVQARVNREALFSATELERSAPLAVSLTWSCSTTNSSGVLRSNRLAANSGYEEMVLSGEVPGSKIASAVDLSLTLHLAATIRHQPGSMSPWLVGSVLWRESRKYLVEGEGARFPVEAKDFGQSGLLPAKAAWYLDWTPSVPTDTFLGAVRLYLNTAHPQIQKLTEGQETEDAERGLLRSVLRTDLARQLIAGALASPAFVEGDDFEAGTVGLHLRTMLGQVFPGRPVHELAAEMRERPHHFEALMQHRLRFLLD